MTRMRSTLVVPVLNEIEAVQIIMPQIDPAWVDEILVIDGGSTDGTVEWLQQQGYTVHSQNGRGFGTGMLLGMRLASGDIIVEFTPDGNALPEIIPTLVAAIESGFDLVIASRYLENAKSEDDDVVTRFGNWMFTTIVNVLFGSRYTDSLVGFRAFRKSAALGLDMNAKGLSWPCQSSIRFAEDEFRVTEIPGDEPKRIGGERKMRPIKTGWEILTLIFREYFRRK